MNKAVFLDRDGVINVDYGYVYKIEDLDFVDGILEFVGRALSRGYLIVIVTNQSGLARKFFTEKEFRVFMKFMIKGLLQGSDKTITYYFDGTHPDIDGLSYTRKPNPGMLLQAQKDLNIDMSKSLLIGDNLSDIEAGAKADVSNLYLLRDYNGRGNIEGFSYRVIAGFSEIQL